MFEDEKCITLQSRGATHQNQYHFEANLTTLLYLFLQNPANDQRLVLHGIYHLCTALRAEMSKKECFTLPPTLYTIITLSCATTDK